MNSKVKKMLFMTMASGMVMGSVCAADAEDLSGKTINVLTHMADQMNAIKTTFEEATGVTVEIDNCSYEELNDQYEVLLSSGSSEYDVVIVDGPNVAAYVSRGYLESLNPYFSEEEIAAFSDNLAVQGTVNGEFYGAPLGDSCTVMYYNKDLLTEAEADWDFDQYDGVNSRITWEELTTFAKEVTEKLDPDGARGITPIEFGTPSEVYMMNTLPNGMGGANISEDGLSVSGIIDSEAWIKALNWYQEMVNEGVFSRGVQGFEGYNNFYAGKSVFILMTTDSYNYAMLGGMTPENLGYTYVPCFAGYEDQVATACGNWTAAINANAKEKDAAGAFVNWITYGEGNPLFLEQESMVPNMAERLTDELCEKVPTLRLAAAESGVTSVSRAVTPGFNEYCAAMNTMWEDIRNGADIESTVAYTIEMIDSALSYYKE